MKFLTTEHMNILLSNVTWYYLGFWLAVSGIVTTHLPAMVERSVQEILRLLRHANWPTALRVQGPPVMALLTST